MITRTPLSCQTEKFDITPIDSPSWQSLLSTASVSRDKLFDQLEIPHGDRSEDPFQDDKAFPLKVPAPYIARMAKGDIHDPLLRQVLPLSQELLAAPGFSEDPLSETEFNPIPGLIHKYHGRALLIVAKSCAIHCRYCFRRHFPYQENQPDRSGWQQALDYLRQAASINEVIYSGGDPLASSDKQLAWLTGKIADIPHLKRLRIHTRLPVVIPARVTRELLAWLDHWRGQKVVVIHCNHPNELDQHVAQAISALRGIGVTVLNQAVLLKGVNDNAQTLIALSEKLFNINVMPYYLHQMDTVAGGAHFYVPETRAKRLIGEVSANLPGYLVPRLVRETPAMASKSALQPIT